MRTSGRMFVVLLSVFTPAAATMAAPRGGARRTDERPLSLAQADLRETSDEAAVESETMEKVSITEDALTEHQSVDAFNSLEDGQPGSPGGMEWQTDIGWHTSSGEHDPFVLRNEFQYTPKGNDFLDNMQLLLGVPVEMGLGGVDGNADIELGWQQRWVKDDGTMPTLATLAGVRLPTGYDSSGVDGTLTGIVAKECGPGTLYVNGFVETANGNNTEDLRHFQWGFRTGYKWRVADTLALIADYLHESSDEDGHANINALELSGMYILNDHLTIGPGILIGLDDNEETPNFGAGVRLQFSF